MPSYSHRQQKPVMYHLPIQPIVERHAKADRCQAAATDSRSQESCEVSMVAVANTGVNPRAVMVHLEDTPSTPPAVV